MKNLLRKEISKKLNRLTQKKIFNNSQKIIQNLDKIETLKSSELIGVYSSKDHEIETKNLINKLFKENKKIFLPKIQDNQLLFKEIKSLNDLELGKFKILEPKLTCKTINPNNLDLLIIPCIAIDTNGNRLGRGGGFYDKLLQNHPEIKTLCLAHEAQLIEKIPTEKHDKKVDLVITEKRIIYPENKVLNGKKLANQYFIELQKKISKEKIKAKLAVILVANAPASEIYVKKKKETCNKISIDFELIRFNEKVTFDTLKTAILKLNKDKNITGTLVQLPLPKHINPQETLDLINPEKDVDGLTTHNLKLLEKGKENLVCCTPKAIIKILEKNNIELQNKNITLVGYGKLVGKPLSMMLQNRNLKYKICNRQTKDLKKETLNADILISATGVAKLITKDHIKENSIIIDAGTSKLNNKIVGDVDFENVIKKASKITPAIGGVGPMTIAMLMENIMKAHKLQNSNVNEKIKLKAI